MESKKEFGINILRYAKQKCDLLKISGHATQTISDITIFVFGFDESTKQPWFAKRSVNVHDKPDSKKFYARKVKIKHDTPEDIHFEDKINDALSKKMFTINGSINISENINENKSSITHVICENNLEFIQNSVF